MSILTAVTNWISGELALLLETTIERFGSENIDLDRGGSCFC